MFSLLTRGTPARFPPKRFLLGIKFCLGLRFLPIFLYTIENNNGQTLNRDQVHGYNQHTQLIFKLEKIRGPFPWISYPGFNYITLMRFILCFGLLVPIKFSFLLHFCNGWLFNSNISHMPIFPWLFFVLSFSPCSRSPLAT